jgi:RNA polymerase sigma-70 factor (ECF subfamily)
MDAGRAIFVDLLRRHEQDLRRAARRLCRGDEDRAQDLAQDTLLRAYDACLCGRFQEGANTRAWFLRILTNLSINDYHQRRRRRDHLDFDVLTSGGEAGPAQTQAAPADTPGVALLAETLDEELEQALAMLSEVLRRCVVLVDLEGREYAEAAQILGVPVGTVRSRLSRARLQLYALLHAYAQERRLA